MKVRTRIPPSPTGIPHIGNTRTALFNYLFTKAQGGELILRIEDTDRARFVPEAEKAIVEILEWLGIKYSPKVERQSERLEIYKQHAEILKNKKLAYTDQGALRYRMPKTGSTKWTDAIGNKDITFENKTQEDFVIIKSDGFPTYNFANVVDDHLMDITHVLRGEEFISSTPKHIQLYRAFGWELPVFAHLPVILGNDHQKLSKRHGAKSALDYRDEGYLKDALLNYMVLLGWNPGGDREIMSINEMIQIFDLKDINTTSPIFDSLKLTWMNQEYIQKKTDAELKDLLVEYYSDLKALQSDVFDKIIPLVKTRIKTLAEFKELTEIFFINSINWDLIDQEMEIAKSTLTDLKELRDWNKDKLFAIMKVHMERKKIKMKVFYKMFTGRERGLPLPETLEILGREKTINILESLIK